jgi:acyl-[acyl-carrier-protein] desaturase
MLAMLDRATEDALYARFRAFFLAAEEERRWNLWEDVPWDRANPAASDDLAGAVVAAMDRELHLPEASAKILYTLRSSRGRAWFVTRWSYEEGKHLLVLGEWLVRSGKRSDQDLREHADRLLAGRDWQLAAGDPPGVMAQALLWELEEIERHRALRARAEAEGDGALVFVADKILADEHVHREFLRDALGIMARSAPEAVAQSARRVAAAPEAGPWGAALLADLDITAPGL